MATRIDLSGLDGNNGFRLDGGADNLSGFSVSNAGDLNGDGFDDLIIGAPWADDRLGSSYVVFGKASSFGVTLDLTSLNGTNGFRMDGLYGVREYLGKSVSNAGDVNGDGFDDLIINAPYGAQNGESFGSSYVIFGKSSGFGATLDLASLDGTNGFRLDGTLVSSLSNAGDVNGDGFDDVIFGAPFTVPNGIDDPGSCYVVFGKASGFDKSLNLSKLNGSNGFRLNGVAEDDATGYSVSSAGDVNGDGLGDLIIGASRADPSGDSSGSSYVVFGKDTGFDATFNLASINGTNGFRLNGETAYDDLGFSVSGAGDVNGDGFDDLIVGARAASNGKSLGASYVVFGKDLGFDAILNLSTLDGITGFRLDGEGFSGWSVSNAGDVNGDGFDDVIVGAPHTSPNGIRDAGSSSVVFGKASGFGDSLDLSKLDGSNGFRLDGVAEYDHLGGSVSSAGDINGDGFDDLIVSAYGADSNGRYSGSSYVIFGRSDFSSNNAINGTPGDDLLKGTPTAQIFEAGAGDDSMIGGGGADVFHGSAGDDEIRVADLSFQLVDGGIGDDVLHLAGSNLNLDLANSDSKISGIETICLYGTGDNTLTLTAADVLNLSDTTNTLKVNGNEGDHIVGLSSGWTDGGSRGAGYYHVYTQDDAVLLVGMNVTTDFAQ